MMPSVISHTAKQQLFLDALVSEEAMGDLRTAMRMAGYSDSTKIAHTARELRKEIKKPRKHYWLCMLQRLLSLLHRS